MNILSILDSSSSPVSLFPQALVCLWNKVSHVAQADLQLIVPLSSPLGIPSVHYRI